MARPLNIEFPGAICNITTRGNERKKIFLNDREREFFVKTLSSNEKPDPIFDLKKIFLVLLLFTLMLEPAYSKDRKPRFELESVTCPKEIIIPKTIRGPVKFEIVINYKYLGPLIETKTCVNEMDSCGFGYSDILLYKYKRIILLNGKYLSGDKEDAGSGSGGIGKDFKFELKNGETYEIDWEMEIDFSRIKEELKNAFLDKKVKSIFLKLYKIEREWEIFEGEVNLSEYKKYKFKLKINKMFKINVRYEE
jgi:hypothetical protein